MPIYKAGRSFYAAFSTESVRALHVQHGGATDDPVRQYRDDEPLNVAWSTTPDGLALAAPALPLEELHEDNPLREAYPEARYLLTALCYEWARWYLPRYGQGLLATTRG